MARGNLTFAAGATAAGAVVAKVALSAPQLRSSPSLVAITWFAVASFAVVGLGLLATDVPPANGWACLWVAWASVPGDLNSGAFVTSGWSAPGYLLELSYLPAAVALILRYPHERLTRAQLWVVVLCAVSTVAVRLPTILTSGPLPDGFYRGPQWPGHEAPFVHDWVFVRGGRALAVATLLAVVVMLLRRLLTSTGLSRQAVVPLVTIGVICASAAAVDQAIWAVGRDNVPAVPADLVRNLSAVAVPVALLADLLRRRSAGAAIASSVVAAAASPRPGAVQESLRAALGDPSLRLRVGDDGTTAERPSATARQSGARRHAVEVRAGDGTALCSLEFDARAVDDVQLVAAAEDALRVGLENRRMHDELLLRMRQLEESRARIVEAGVLERRRVERDLHDGAQQQLLAVCATLARVDVVGDGELRPIVGEARGQLREALAELRRLARGIHPSALAVGGLPGAVRGLCQSIGFPSSLTVDDALRERRLPAVTEATAYFAVAEALANAMRHGSPTRVVVDLSVREGWLRASVCDDGGGGARLVPGGGLAGIAERVDALGGTLDLDCGPAGSTVLVRLPVDANARQEAES